MRIRYGVWDGPAGQVFLFPGRTEYIEKYGRVITKLAARGLGCVVLDWRNQGLSDRAASTGHVEDYAEYQRDFDAVLAAATPPGGTENMHLLSHSMGGLIALRTLERGQRFKTAAHSAPMWGMGLAAPMRGVMKALSGIAPGLGLGQHKILGAKRGSYIQGANPNDNSLMSDPETAKWIQRQLNAHPELALGGPSWAWLKASHREIADLSAYPVPNLPTVTFLGDRETVVSSQVIDNRMAGPQNGELVMVAGAKHEVLMETPAIQTRVWAKLDTLWGVANTA